MQSLQDINWNSWHTKYSATLTFIVKNDLILLIRKKRGVGAGKISGPGGKLELGETLLECAIREVQEELCITPIDPEFIGDNLFQFTNGNSLHVHTYLAYDFDGIPTETDEANPLWFSLITIPYHEMWEDDKVWLPELLKAQKFRGLYLFDGDSMLDYQLELR
ncbi:MAG: 8-oxo-dGTP diphosphatase [Candidatus Endonucleobacter bathymodioli]|uniref:Oxidized purine nucleoside triphosphate hydrolase n=1 Tax=Candidatus Endonucleibacter bathymodioli TaxID=539814 RepID=A0AA90SDI9_9GAMM|nr:8-oxo-dGTP diphosphatase [Candidatus Endonucleobacter bathymodioli]